MGPAAEAEVRIEGLLIRLADGALRRGDQLGQVVDRRLVDTGARVLEAEVTVALVGEQDGVAEVLLGAHGLGIARGGVVAATHADCQPVDAGLRAVSERARQDSSLN